MPSNHMTTSDTVLTNRPTMGGMTIRIVPIEPPWFEEKAQVQSCTWRELNQGHIPQGIVDAITPEFALKLTRSHAKDPNQVVLVALENNHVIGFAELLQTPRSPIKRSEAAELASLYVLESCHRHGVGRLWLRQANAPSATIGSPCGSPDSTPTPKVSTVTSASMRPA